MPRLILSTSYMTDGLLVAQAYQNRMFKGYHTVIIDEAHECNANIYLLLALVRRAVEERKLEKHGNLKVIIMSATMSVDKFVKYFDSHGKTTAMHIDGMTYPVDLRYLGKTPRLQTPANGWAKEVAVQPQVSDIVEEACRTVASIVRNNMPPGNILVFMPGVPEVDKTCRRIGKNVEGV
jgi:HrpA-like RNA helicase